MDDRISPAIEALKEQLQKQLNEVAETKKAINALCRASGQDPMFPDVSPEHVGGGTGHRTRYYGRPLATVAQEFLESRREACSPEEIFDGLKAGAFDFKGQGWGGNDKDWIRNLSISLAKNTKAFHRLPNGFFGLVTWYSDITTRRERDGAKSERTRASQAVPNGGSETAADKIDGEEKN